MLKVVASTRISTLSLHDALPISNSTRDSGSYWARSRAHSISAATPLALRSEEHTSELQSHSDLVCRLLLEKKNKAMDEEKWLNILGTFVKHSRSKERISRNVDTD